MTATDEIMTPVSTSEAASLANAHAMRQVADSLRVLSDVVSAQGKAQAEHSAASTRAMERLTDKVDGMGTRLTRLEEAKHGREIERLESGLSELSKKVDQLEGVRDKATGAMGATGWVAKYAPWILTVAVALAAGLGIDQVAK
jgi:hypothetical protein